MRKVFFDISTVPRVYLGNSKCMCAQIRIGGTSSKGYYYLA